MDLIEIDNLCHRFADGIKGLHNIQLHVKEGEFVVIAGRNGSGKTTLLKHLNGLLRPHSGAVHLDGVPVEKNVKRARQLVGMVFQDADSQIVGETVYADVAFGPENLGLSHAEIAQRVAEALKAVGLTELAEQSPHLLSGGEKRRVAIAGILAMQARILAFDEPFSNLDYPGVRQVLAHIVRLQKEGHTIFLTTHDLEKVVAHATRLVILQEGRIVRDGPPLAALKNIDQYGIREPCLSRLGMELTSWLN
jgi:biotin transport system ATP-binding protein